MFNVECQGVYLDLIINLDDTPCDISEVVFLDRHIGNIYHTIILHAQVLG